MASKQELLILARLRNEASRPIKDIKGDLNSLSNELRDAEKVTAAQAKQLRQLGREAKQSAREAKELADRWQDAGRRMTTFVSLPIVAFLGASARAASDMNEAVNRTSVVFGAAAQQVHSYAQDTSKNLLMSKRAAEEAAGGFGALLVPMGFSQQRAAEMSIALTALSQDLSSFYNVATDEAMTALRSGLVGETEPLRRLGVQLSAARIESVAYAKGIAQVGEELTAAQKAEAAFQIVLMDTAQAQGDAARTMDGAANSLRGAQARIEDSMASLGQVVLPMIADLAGHVADLAGWFETLPGPIQTSVVALLAVTALAGPMVFLASQILQIRAALMTARVAGTAWSATMTTAAATVSAALAGVTLGVLAGLNEIRKSEEAARESLEEFGPAPVDDRAKLLEHRNELVKEYNRLQRIGDQGGGLMGNLKELGQALPGGSGSTISNAQRATHVYADEIERLDGVLADTDWSAEQADGALDKFGNTVRVTADAVKELRDEFDLLLGRFLSVDEAAIAQREAVLRVAEVLADPQASLDDQQSAVIDAFRATETWATAALEAGEITEAQFWQVQIDKAHELADMFPQLIGFIDTYSARLATADVRQSATTAVGNVLAGLGGINLFGGSPIGDTPRPMGWDGASSSIADTMAIHSRLDSEVPGRRMVTSSVRSFGLGSQDSDHAHGRALDLVGTGLNEYAQAVRKIGGFAEFHGGGSRRHLHVVPQADPRRTGVSTNVDTADPGIGPTLRQYDVRIIGSGLDELELKRAIRDGIRDADREDEERGRR